MVVAINGKVVGGMTEFGVELELELSGPALILVISRYKHSEEVAKKFASTERQILQVMDTAARDARLIGWLEIGNAKPLNSTDCGEKHKGRLKKGLPRHENENDGEASLNEAERTEKARDRNYEHGDHSSAVAGHQAPRSVTSQTVDDDNDDDENSSKDWDEDDNAWLGCVCGKIHMKGSRGVFWIQCESCRSWFDVHETCVGFKEHDVQALPNWTCDACPSSAPHEEMPRICESKLAGGGQDQEASSIASSKVMEVGSKQTSTTRGCLGVSLEKTKGLVRNTTQPLVDICRTVDQDRESFGNTGYDGHLSETSQAQSMPKTQRLSLRQRHGALTQTLSTCIFPTSNPRRLRDGAFAQPEEEPVPIGMKSDKIRALWVAKRDDDMHKNSQGVQGASSELVCEEVTNNPVDRAPGPDGPLRLSAKKVDARTTKDGCLLPKLAPICRGDGSFKRPAGPTPDGMKWHDSRGLWVPKVIRITGSEKVKSITKGGKLRSPPIHSSWQSSSSRRRLKRVGIDGFEGRRTQGGITLPRSKPKRMGDDTFVRPPGPSPAGMEWDGLHGWWVLQASKTGVKQSGPYTPDSIPRPLRSRSASAPSHASENGSDESSLQSGEVEILTPGTRVNVEAHSWPRKSCFGGVGYVTSTFVDEDGDRLYNVKYVLGGSDKNIEAEYVSLHEFV
jgi:hypothetical protein